MGNERLGMGMGYLGAMGAGAGDDKTCNIYAKYKNRSRGGFFGTGLNGYEGIPQNLVLNIIGWMIMILIFSVLRKKAWNYGRLAVVSRNERGNPEFGRNSNPIDGPVLLNGGSETSEQSPAPSATTQLLKPNSSSPENNHLSNEHDYSRIVHSEGKVIMDTGYFSWIKIVFSLTDKQILEKCGFDCVQYLSFQRHLIFLASIVTLTSLVIVLPINYQGTPLTDQTAQFNQTTIINLKHDVKLLWVHVILAITFLFLSIAVMRHFSRALKFVEDDPAVRRSIMIVGICRRFCSEEKLKLHFEEIYPDVELSEVTFAYDISVLQSKEFSRQTASMAITYWENYLAKFGKRPTMTPYYCGALCCSSPRCGCDSRDALDFYGQEELLYTREVVEERTKAFTKPLGIAFVTFKTVDMAERVVNDYRFVCKLLGQTPQSKFSRNLKSKRWTINFAPLPEDIYWENLATGLKSWYVKVFIVNIILALIVTFYTTPVFLLQAIIPLLNMTQTNATDDPTVQPSALRGFMIDTVPTLLLWIVAVTLPSLVSVSDKIVGFWTKTGENRSRMIKVFSFLIFMVVILPSLGITSLTAIIQDDLTIATDALKWQCIFSKDNGALFVNYICTSTFLGTASELMRLPELFIYCIKLCFARSAAEIAAIRQSVLWDFQIGSQYAWMMLNFAIFSVFSVIFPVVTPFGLVYLVFKHYVDRYNIYFAYGPTKVEKEVHGTAINFVIVCMFILQINLLAYVTTQGTDNDSDLPVKSEAKGLKVFCVVGFCITAALFISQIFFNMCANFSPILYKRISQDGLNLNQVVRNGDASTSRGNGDGDTASAALVPFSSQRTNLEAPKISHASPAHLNLRSTNSSSSANGGGHHVRNRSYGYDDETMFPGRRKYFPKLLQPPKQRPTGSGTATGVFPSPSPSAGSAISSGINGRAARIQKNGASQIVTAVMVNEQGRITKEEKLYPIVVGGNMNMKASTNSSV